MLPRPPRATHTDTPFPSPTLFRSFRRITHVKPQESFAEQPVGAIKLGERDERARGILLGQLERIAAVEQQVPAPVADPRRRADARAQRGRGDRKSTRLNSSH